RGQRTTRHSVPYARPELTYARLDRLAIHSNHLVDESRVARQAACAGGAVRLAIEHRRRRIENPARGVGRCQQHDVGEDFVAAHHTAGAHITARRLDDVLLDEQWRAIRARSAHRRRHEVEDKTLAAAVVDTSRLENLRVEKCRRGRQRDARATDETRIAIWN